MRTWCLIIIISRSAGTQTQPGSAHGMDLLRWRRTFSRPYRALPSRLLRFSPTPHSLDLGYSLTLFPTPVYCTPEIAVPVTCVSYYMAHMASSI